MTYAHQPGSQPIEIPDRIPNPVVKPRRAPAPQQPVRTPEKQPADYSPDRIALISGAGVVLTAVQKQYGSDI
jgi:hypothetical protein